MTRPTGLPDAEYIRLLEAENRHLAMEVKLKTNLLDDYEPALRYYSRSADADMARKALGITIPRPASYT